MIPPHLSDQIAANVADTQAQSVLSASLPPVEKADTFEAHGFTWTKHVPGDPMPCNADSEVFVFTEADLRNRPYNRPQNLAQVFWWNGTGIIGWRFATQTEPKREAISNSATPITDQLWYRKPTPEQHEVYRLARNFELELTTLRAENESMKDAIKEAHFALGIASQMDTSQTCPDENPGIVMSAMTALDKLKPFLP